MSHPVRAPYRSTLLTLALAGFLAAFLTGPVPLSEAQTPAPMETPEASTSPEAAPEVTLELIMSDPDWIGNPPERPYWADDGQSIYYFQKRPGSEQRDLVEIDLRGERIRTLEVGRQGLADAPDGEYDRERTRKVFSRSGDLFLRDLSTGEQRQLTRTTAAESRPRFLAGGESIVFERDGAVYVRDLATGLEYQPLDVRLEKDPEEAKAEAEKKASYLEAQQERLFKIVREDEEDAEEAKRLERIARREDPTRVPPPFYLGEGIESPRIVLAPTGEWALVGVAEKREPGRSDLMPNYVTADGYVSTRGVRPKVGHGEPAPEKLYFLDLDTHEMKEVDLSVLPMISDDPLAELRRKAKEAKAGEEEGGESAEDALVEEDLSPEEMAEEAASEPAEEVAEAERRGTDEAEGAGLEVVSVDPEAEDGEGEDGDEDAEGEEEGEKKEKAEPRPVFFGGMTWSDDGRHAALMAYSTDNKDRWIFTVDPETGEARPIHHMRNQAWLGWSFDEMGWIPGTDTLWYTSEETGFSQIYVVMNAGVPNAGVPNAGVPNAGVPNGGWVERRQLTSGEFEISQVESTKDGRWLYFRANREHPGIYEIYRVPTAGGEIERITYLQGMTEGELSPDDRRLLLTHSTTTRPPELYLQSAEPPAGAGAGVEGEMAAANDNAPPKGPMDAPEAGMEAESDMAASTRPADGARPPGRGAVRLTHTVSERFAAIDWVKPRIVEVPSSHVNRPIYSRLYLPDGTAGSTGGDLPAVFFIHGAGYLQNAHHGWSGYFREFMFHTFLTRQGYVVLDMDYRASAGYGRDWRTAIYRHMGKPEVEDLVDGLEYVVREHGVDRDRVGLYGGSYGGFLTMMALFTEPGTFQAGAALRPVTDWAHYNHGYTSAILNTPEIDPEAFERSSPIEFADGLEDPLLICAPMQDDNVLFQDVVRLSQRLIELEKEDWWVAIYPIEPHGFRKPSSWLDEYRRIYKWMESYVK